MTSYRHELGRIRGLAGFSLVEMLLVITVIGILSALIIPMVINTAQDSRMVVARQQQAAVQEALNAWIVANSSGTNSLQTARTAYTSSSDRLTLVKDYLDSSTYQHFTNYSASTSGPYQSEAMKKVGVSFAFTDWTNAAATNYPRVNMQ